MMLLSLERSTVSLQMHDVKQEADRTRNDLQQTTHLLMQTRGDLVALGQRVDGVDAKIGNVETHLKAQIAELQCVWSQFRSAHLLCRKKLDSINPQCFQKAMLADGECFPSDNPKSSDSGLL